jgi:hypothetical protein
LFWLFSQSYVDPVPLSKRSGIRQSSADKQRYQKCHIDPLVKNTAPSVTDALFCPLFPMGGCWHIPFQVPALLTQAADPTRGRLDFHACFSWRMGLTWHLVAGYVRC